MPGIGRGPAQIRRGGAQAGGEARELGGDRLRQGNGEEEAHGTSLGSQTGEPAKIAAGRRACSPSFREKEVERMGHRLS